MKAWRDLSAVAMPARMARLARDRRGYPITAHARVVDGVVDFRTMDPYKVAALIQRRCCALCGEPLGSRMAFVGGPRSTEARCYTDGPMHRDCAIYALQVCPFLAAPSFGYRKSAPEDAVVNEAVTTQRPDVFGLGICRDFAVGLMGGQHLVMQASPFESVSWWRHGANVDAPGIAGVARSAC